MPKTLPIANPASPTAQRLVRVAPVALFAVAYLAVLGILFAPEGFFLAATDTDPAVIGTAAD